MPEIPEGAKLPTDHKQTLSLAPVEHPDGWDLLRSPMEAEEWETADLVAAVTTLRSRGEEVELVGSVVTVIGQLAKTMQTLLARDSNSFRAWLKETPNLLERYSKIVTLAGAYMAELGELDSSAS